ncbi:MAG: hypothetical protein HC808_07635 [Candidatus Competibacteraceae bacterium]|nr:hypothetical protein [Candidatus Competibacteraceae bacterium]
MKGDPVDVDLDDLWHRLGVSITGQHVAFDDTAPLAWLRRALTNGPVGRQTALRVQSGFQMF